MAVLTNIKNFIAGVDEKEFYKYAGVLTGFVILILLGIAYYRYNRVHFWRSKINAINEQREEIRMILDKDQLVLSQRHEVNDMLTQDPDYKIEGYFTSLIDQLGFASSKKPKTSITYADRGDPEYQEVNLKAEFHAIDMKQLTELLDAIEHNKRIYTKELEIIKSKEVANAIDVNLTVATLQHKSEQTELAE